MQDSPIRIAVVMGKMLGGGVESVVMNYYRQIDHKKVQFDFIIDNDSTTVPEKEINYLGGRVFRVAPYQHLHRYQKDLKKIFKNNHYNIVHSHLNTLSVFPLKVAKECGIPIRIAHNHSTSAPGERKKNLLKNIFRKFSKIYPTHYMSPTYDTGKWLFGKKVADNELFVIKDAISIEKFKFNKNVRKVYREKLGFNNLDFVIGNIGRLVWQKNQSFVLEVFKRVSKQMPAAKLLIIGQGPLKKDLQNKVKKLNLEKKVLFLEYEKNIEDLYQVMDCFLLPSFYEGLGMVGIEAQASGINTICSDRVPTEVGFSTLCTFISLDSGPNVWAEKIMNIKNKNNFIKRPFYYEKLVNSGYDIKTAAVKLTNIYISLNRKVVKK